MLHLDLLKAENGFNWKVLLGYREMMREFLPYYLDLSLFEVEDEETCLDVFWWGFLYYTAYEEEAKLMVEYNLDKVLFDEDGYIVEYGIDQNGLINDVFKNVLETFAEDEDLFKIDNKIIFDEYEEYAILFFFGLYQTYIIKNNIDKPTHYKN